MQTETDVRDAATASAAWRRTENTSFAGAGASMLVLRAGAFIDGMVPSMQRPGAWVVDKPSLLGLALEPDAFVADPTPSTTGPGVWRRGHWGAEASA